MNGLKRLFCVLIYFTVPAPVFAQQNGVLKNIWSQPPESAKPWVFWYWMQGAVTKEGITADLEAMKEIGLGGAYLMPIKGPASPPYINPPVVQLSPEWWDMLKYSFTEAKRLNLQLGMHVSDGFALAGGPWITPELSMQKLVWTKTIIKGGQVFNDTLPQPETGEGYYKEVAVLAYPSPKGTDLSTRTIIPKITGSKPDSIAQFLIRPDNKKSFGCDEQCWLQYEFAQPFTCRSLIIRSKNNYQANRLIVQTSDDGAAFKTIKRLEPPRHGWQDVDADYTYSVPAATARFFRFVFDKEGSEPGAEDLDAAKWKPVLRISGIELSGEAKIDGYEGKSGEIWRISAAAAEQQVPKEDCLPLDQIVDLSDKLSKDGKLNWEVPPGNWTILRMGHTSTGHRNETAGGGKGLECDKFNPAAVTLQFNSWFGEVYNRLDANLVKEVLRYFHVDSWECGSQNWSANFGDEFKKRRGYDLLPYLPAMAGVPVETNAASEKVLLHVRQTIAELVNDKFYETLAALAKKRGVQFSAESVAPTMVSDGMLHYKSVDLPMGEFWLRSPTHDKPNDMLDAISGAHIYGKNIVQAEAFTELRMAWDEHPGMLKTLLDRNYALGMNRVFYHVMVHNPWLRKKPGMTLDPIGLYFQRDQTWWKQGRAWVDYAKRCQALLQFGKPVADIAVFTGEDLPRRAVLPDRLVPVLPGIFGEEKVAAEAKRLSNKGQPLVQMPAGVTHSANMTEPQDWTDPLHGYTYDSYNADALLRLTSVKNGRLQLATGAAYRLLILPGANKMSPNTGMLSNESAEKIRQLVNDGATILVNDSAVLLAKLLKEGPGYAKNREAMVKDGFMVLGKGRLTNGPYHESSFEKFGLDRDVIVLDRSGKRAEGVAWTHRAGNGVDIYFISNQKDSARELNLSLRANGRLPQIWDPVDGTIIRVRTWYIEKGRTGLPVYLDRNASLFIVLQQPTRLLQANSGANWVQTHAVQKITGPWTVSFDTAFGGPAKPVVWKGLKDWSTSADPAIKYYSGTAIYSNTFSHGTAKTTKRVWINLNDVRNVAGVWVNDKFCGTAWTYPYRVEITNALKPGVNSLHIELVNTWANRMIGDAKLPVGKQVSQTVYPFKMEGKPLLPAGLLGPIVIETDK